MSLSYAYSIPDNRGSARPSQVLFLDVESHVIDQGKGVKRFEPFLWCLIAKRYRYHGQKSNQVTYVGNDLDKLWNLVVSYCKQKRNVYLTAHHLEVDIVPTRAIQHLMSRGFELEHVIAHNRVLILYFKRDKARLTIINNGNLASGSIEQWGEMLDCPKLPMPDSMASADEWEQYVTRDAEIMVKIWDALLEFLDIHDLGNFKQTQAGLAMAAFRHRFMQQKIVIHKHVKALDLERASYKGGRFEALKIGNFKNDTWYTLDVNSMYGWLMSAKPLPYELRGYDDRCDLKRLAKLLDRYAVIAEVQVTTSEPCLPRSENNKTIFAPGTFITTLTTPELKYCVQKGYVDQVFKVAWYYHDLILSKYADYFLSLKDRYDREGNKPMRQVTKLYLNALYGKFAQHGFVDEIVGECDPDEFRFGTEYDYDTKERYELNFYGGKIHRVRITKAGKYTLVALSSHIAAYARMRLWELMTLAGLENVYHTATDSLLVNEVGYHNLTNEIDPHQPGKLKIEKSYAKITIHDVNDMILDGQLKIKGIPKKAVQLSDNSWLVTHWSRLTTVLNNNRGDYYYVRELTKTLNRPRFRALEPVANPETG
jgi:hypothetical protein